MPCRSFRRRLCPPVSVQPVTGSRHLMHQKLAPRHLRCLWSCNFLCSLCSQRPGVVRGIAGFQVLQHAPRYWWQGLLHTLHRYSRETTEIDEFWSHSWQAATWLKYLNILFLSNGMPAFLVGMLGVMLAGTWYPCHLGRSTAMGRPAWVGIPVVHALWSRRALLAAASFS